MVEELEGDRIDDQGVVRDIVEPLKCPTGGRVAWVKCGMAVGAQGKMRG